jgi:integrase
MNAQPSEIANTEIITLPAVQPKPKAAKIELGPRFKIKSFGNASGTVSWRVDGYKRDGSRVRQNFADENKAKSAQIALETEYAQGHANTGIKATRLTDEQISLAEAAFIRLPDPRELPLAIEHWLRTGKQAPVESPRLDDAFTQFSQWLDKCELRDLSIKNLRRRVNVFINSVPNLKVSDVTSEAIDGYLTKRAVSAKSKDNDRRAVSRFFSWCMGYEDGDIRAPRRWTPANPCRREKRGKGGPKEDSKPAILTVKECEALLRKAERFERGRLAPYVAVCLFGGLRPFEAARLTWDTVNLTDKEIRLEGEQTKTGRSRVVAICKTLGAWLKAYKDKSFFPPNWRRDLDAIKESAGLINRETAKSKGTFQKKKKGKLVQAHRYWKKITPVNWVPDIMRHTAISYYFRKTGSYGETAEQFGNSEAIIKNHYQGRVSTEDTKAFYALLPKKGGRK